jgi:hypothetical protein
LDSDDDSPGSLPPRSYTNGKGRKRRRASLSPLSPGALRKRRRVGAGDKQPSGLRPTTSEGGSAGEELVVSSGESDFSPGPDATVVSDDDEAKLDIIAESAKYADELLRHTTGHGTRFVGLVPFFVTVTFPGGLTERHVKSFVAYCRSVNTARHYIYVLEGDGVSKHRHLHALVWANQVTRTDSLSRGIRSRVFHADDLDNVAGTRRLIRTQSVSDLAGVCRYMFKDTAKFDDVHSGWNSVVDEDYAVRLVHQLWLLCREYWERKSTTGVGDRSVFPDEGKTKFVSPNSVADVLLAAAREMGMPIKHHYGFAQLVAACLRRGLRFDLTRLKSARLTLEILEGDLSGWAQDQIHQMCTNDVNYHA